MLFYIRVHTVRVLLYHLVFVLSSLSNGWCESISKREIQNCSDSQTGRIDFSHQHIMRRISGLDMAYAYFTLRAPARIPFIGFCCVFYDCTVVRLSRSIVQPLAWSWYIIGNNPIIVSQTPISKITLGVFIGLFHGDVHVQTFGGVADKLHMVCKQMKLADDLKKRWRWHELDALW